MNTQTNLNLQAMKKLPKVYKIFCGAKDAFERGKIDAIFFREAMNCSPCLDDMSICQKEILENKILSQLIED